MNTSILAPIEPRLERYATREEWLAGRDRTPYRIGGSDVAAILGISPWASPWDVWARKTGAATVEPDAAKEALFERGRRWEPTVLREYAVATGRELIDVGEALIVHPSEPWVVGSPDALARDGEGLGGVEAKTAIRVHGWAPEDTEIIEYGEGSEAALPPHYATQAYWYLEASGLPWWDCVVLLPRYEVRVVRLHRDPKVQAELLAAVGAWRERHLIGGEPPPVDASGACRAWLSGAFPGDPTKRAVQAAPDVAALMADAMEADAAAKAATARKKATAAALQAAMGDTYKAIADCGSAVCTLPSERRTIDAKRLAADHPDLARQYERASPIGRSIRLYPRK